jgi:hypothetical protein
VEFTARTTRKARGENKKEENADILGCTQIGNHISATAASRTSKKRLGSVKSLKTPMRFSEDDDEIKIMDKI